MRIIGLTGSIACGKSTVSSFLISRGFPVIDGDRIARELTASGSPVLQDIYRTFGPGFFSADGSLNRRRLGQLVFSDPQARQALDDLMAPHLLSATRRHIDECRGSGAALCFLDMPLLYEKRRCLGRLASGKRPAFPSHFPGRFYPGGGNQPDPCGPFF